MLHWRILQSIVESQTIFLEKLRKAHTSRCFPDSQETFRENENNQGTEVETINVRTINIIGVKECIRGEMEYESKWTIIGI